MTASTTGTEPEQTGGSTTPPLTAVAVAGVASLGAGAIHAAAIGAHNEHQAVVVTFALLAAFQLAWGAVALAVRPSRRAVVAVGATGNGAAVIGWVLAKTSGLAFIPGLAQAEPVQLADGAAAALALVAALLAATDLLLPARRTTPVRRGLVVAATLPIAGIALASMVSAGSHTHAGDHDHSVEVATAHDHGDDVTADHQHGGDTTVDHAAGHDHTGGTTVNPGPFDPAETVDLSGVPGVTPQQQAEAEALLTATLDRLPQFADLSTLNAKGYYSIGDAITGDEHYVNWSYVNDGRILDPDHPESLVIRHRNGTQQLVAAMFMLPEGTTLDQVPAVGGSLIQWHVHADLCFTDDPVRPTLAFNQLFVGVQGECTPPNTKRGNLPMVHVWIVPNPCGPFAALEGIGGGQIAAGETVACDAQHAHVGGDATGTTLPVAPVPGRPTAVPTSPFGS